MPRRRGYREPIERQRRAASPRRRRPSNRRRLAFANRNGVHLHAQISPEPSARFNIKHLAWGERLLENVAVAVQQDHAVSVSSDEAIDEEPAALREEDVREALLPGEIVGTVARCEQKLVLADIDFEFAPARRASRFFRALPPKTKCCPDLAPSKSKISRPAKKRFVECLREAGEAERDIRAASRARCGARSRSSAASRVRRRPRGRARPRPGWSCRRSVNGCARFVPSGTGS